MPRVVVVTPQILPFLPGFSTRSSPHSSPLLLSSEAGKIAPSLECYVLIELKYNYEKWVKQANDEINNCNNRKYVSKGSQGNEKDDQHGSRKMTLYTETKYHKSIDGWNQEDMNEYNCLCWLVANDQETEVGKLFQNFFFFLH